MSLALTPNIMFKQNPTLYEAVSIKDDHIAIFCICMVIFAISRSFYIRATDRHAQSIRTAAIIEQPLAMSTDPSTDRQEHADTSFLHAFHALSQGVNHKMQNSDNLAELVSVCQLTSLLC